MQILHQVAHRRNPLFLAALPNALPASLPDSLFKAAVARFAAGKAVRPPGCAPTDAMEINRLTGGFGLFPAAEIRQRVELRQRRQEVVAPDGRKTVVHDVDQRLRVIRLCNAQRFAEPRYVQRDGGLRRLLYGARFVPCGSQDTP